MKFEKLIDNRSFRNSWQNIALSLFLQKKDYGDYHEALAFSYNINPIIDYCMSNTTNIFDIKKAKAIYKWYKKHDSKDDSITKYFEEYKHCIDKDHPDFNSNYGLYAYSQEGLDKCIRRLAQNTMTRQAMFCINNNEAMSDRSIDKLCTNTIQFFIRNNRLIMCISMRASNFFTLLPYDLFMFCFWYFYVYNKLYNEYNMKDLGIEYINIHAATIHYYDKNLDNIQIQEYNENIYNLFENYKDKDFITLFENKLNAIQ